VSVTVDPVTVEVIRNGFLSIARQMNNNLVRSAYTPIIYEMHDCSVGVFDRRGRLLGQSPGLPMFLGNLELGILSTIEKLGGTENFADGDVYMVNDPYLVGSHTYDVNVFSPIFLDDQLIGFGATKAHWLDIGAKEAGRPVDTTEIYQEGYRFGPTAIYRAGEPVSEVLDYITRNSRLPKSVWGDLHAQIAACRTGEQRLRTLYRKFGLEQVDAATEIIFEHCEELDREAVGRIPDGTYRASGFMDSGGPGLPKVDVVVAVNVCGTDISVDLAGSSGPTNGPVNSPLPGTVAAARLAFKCLVNPDVPVTDGTFRNLSVEAPAQTVFNVSEPHATIYYYPPLGLLIDLIIRAMADALPDFVVAGQTADPMNITFVGERTDESRFVTGAATAVGWGAGYGHDGENGLINYGAGDLKNIPVEVVESKYPIRIREYGLRVDSGGCGRWRGGLGISCEYETLENEMEMTLWLERSLMPAWGLNGGSSGAPTRGTVTVDGVDQEVVKCPPMRLPVGSRVRVMTGGGGGYGCPSERDPKAIEDDLLDGYVSSWPS